MKITADRKRKRPPREIVWTTHPPPSTRRVAPHNIRTKKRRISDEAQAAVTEEDFWSLFITVKNLYTRWRCSFDFRVWPKQCCSVADPGCLSRIPDPTFFHPGSRIRTVSIPNHGSASKNLSIVTTKYQKKWFLSSNKYDPGCSSRIPDPDADFLPIPDPVSRDQKGTGWIPDPDPQHCKIGENS
jgi:hypothetical protein